MRVHYMQLQWKIIVSEKNSMLSYGVSNFYLFLCIIKSLICVMEYCTMQAKSFHNFVNHIQEGQHDVYSILFCSVKAPTIRKGRKHNIYNLPKKRTRKWMIQCSFFCKRYSIVLGVSTVVLKLDICQNLLQGLHF